MELLEDKLTDLMKRVKLWVQIVMRVIKHNFHLIAKQPNITKVYSCRKKNYIPHSLLNFPKPGNDDGPVRSFRQKMAG